MASPKGHWIRGKQVALERIPKARFSFTPWGQMIEHIFRAVLPQNDPEFDICVTDKVRPQAVALFRALVKRLSADGIRVSAEKQHSEVKTVLTGLGSRVELAIKERLCIQRLLPEGESYSKKMVWVPTGILRVTVEAHGWDLFHVNDVKKLGTTSRQAAAVRDGVVEALRYVAEIEAQKERERLAEWDEFQRREKEKKRRSDLLAQAEAWCRPRMVNEYLDALERHAVEKGEQSAEFRSWLEWARSVAGTVHLDARAEPTRLPAPTTFSDSDFWAGFWTGRR
jgi:hypothetical protein